MNNSVFGLVFCIVRFTVFTSRAHDVIKDEVLLSNSLARFRLSIFRSAVTLKLELDGVLCEHMPQRFKNSRIHFGNSSLIVDCRALVLVLDLVDLEF